MRAHVTGKYDWLCTGDEMFSAMLAAIDAATASVDLETYIFQAGTLAERFRDALVRARIRGLQVRVLIDALGSYELPSGFLTPVTRAGGRVRWFNPLSLFGLSIRNHRKLLVCDERVAFIGGFNIAPEYEGDGVKRGWCDLGMRVEGPLVKELAASFEDLFARAPLRQKLLLRLPRFPLKRAVRVAHEQLLLGGPGAGYNPIKAALKRDLARAGSVQIMVAYFLPTWKLRRQLSRIARRGGEVQLLLAGKSDVDVAWLAAQSLYGGLLKAGVQIQEYQPQVLHAKMIVVDDVVYVGSANLDQRSLLLNFELMVRIPDRLVASQAREIFHQRLKHCRSVSVEAWRQGRSWWRRFKQRWAYFLLVHIDPYIVRHQWRGLPD